MTRWTRSEAEIKMGFTEAYERRMNGEREPRRAPSTYWHRHPRGFANECDLVRAETTEQADRLAVEGYRRLTRRELAEHIRWLNDENDAWGSNRAFGRISFKAVTTSQEYSYR